ncbi:(2Fe-2S) ferredoxin domain-containing protein [Halobaculum sp. CBA1158]|uniref:(2Fe-2S) ferredoxin domain-containing protein n=1 Tax=Halobaculum sp. CBA1158 TaxID=2904243 RepID=UPI001F3E834D|nr:(2Fe-2S) ferredoxin domain-containing protein [Halobaculum sp. CBA1158]UIO99834.1 (2Fe-2S) ferredoxin domain-containing protein [Halobaculum sp. CBA1158]
MRDRTDDVYENGFTDHVLVCTNARDSEYAACADAHGEAVLEAVRTWLRDRGVFWSRVHVAETSCLGLCSAEGTAVAVHPRGRWFSDVTPGDVPELLADVFGSEASDLRVGPSPEVVESR